MPEPEEVDLDDAEVGAVVLVPLDDDAAGHRRRLERHDLVEPAGRDHHAAGVLPEVARQILDLHVEAHEVLHARLLGVEAGCGQLVGEGSSSRLADLAEVPGAELSSTSLSDLLGRVAEGLAHFARRGAVAVGDDVRGHRRAVLAVLL